MWKWRVQIVFTYGHIVSSYANFLEQRKVFNPQGISPRKTLIPKGHFWHINMAVVYSTVQCLTDLTNAPVLTKGACDPAETPLFLHKGCLYRIKFLCIVNAPYTTYQIQTWSWSPPRGWGGGEYFLIWPIRGCAAGQGMVFDLSVLNKVYNFVWVCQHGIACTIDLIWRKNIVCTPSICCS